MVSLTVGVEKMTDDNSFSEEEKAIFRKNFGALQSVFPELSWRPVFEIVLAQERFENMSLSQYLDELCLVYGSTAEVFDEIMPEMLRLRGTEEGKVLKNKKKFKVAAKEYIEYFHEGVRRGVLSYE